MAFDLKMEIFAFKLFRKYWYDLDIFENEPDVLKIYGDECAGDSSYMEACDDLFLRALYQRSYVTSTIQIPEVTFDEIKNFTSLSEVCNYIINKCNGELIFSYLTVFEKILATSDFVINVCYFIYMENNNVKDVLKYSHMFWVIYFDIFTEKFYKEGGWNKFKIVAKSYDVYEDLFPILGINTICGSLKCFKEAVVNYHHFKNVLHYHESKKRKCQQKVCVSVLWIKVRIQFFNHFIRIPLNYEDFAVDYDVFFLLEDLRYFCDPSSYYKLNVPEISQENGKKRSLIENSDNFDCNLGIEDTFRNECSNRLDTEKQIKNEYLISSADKLSLVATKNIENIQFAKNPSAEKELLRCNASNEGMIENSRNKQIGLPNLTMYRQMEGNEKLQKIVEDNYTSILNEDNSSRNVGEQGEFTVESEVFSINQKGEYECNQETVQKRYSNQRIITSLNESANSRNKMKNSNELLQVNLNSENAEIQDKSKINNKDSTNLTALNCNGSNSSDILLKPKKLSCADQCVNTVDEPEKIYKNREDLSIEQNNPEIQKFLRLILVLGDQQEVKSVCASLRNSKECAIKLQEKSNKKKSKSKKAGN